MLLLAFLPAMQATAADPTAIGVSITESFTRTDTYQPDSPTQDGTVAVGTTGGSGTLTITNQAGTGLYNVVLNFGTGYTNGWVQQSGDTVSATVSDGLVTIAYFPAGASIHIDYTPAANYVPPVTLTTTYSQNSVTNSVSSSTVIHLTATLNTTTLPSDVTTVTPTITITSANNPLRGNSTLLDWDLNATSWSHVLSASSSTATTNILATIHDTAALNDSSSASSVQPLANSSIVFSITSSNSSASGIYMDSSSASTTNVQSGVTKQFNVTSGMWEFTPQVTTTGTLTYTLTSVSEWAVNQSNTSATIASQNVGPLSVDLTGSTWTGTGSQILSFAYNGIPAGFIKPSISLKDTSDQFGIMDNGAVSHTTGSNEVLVKSIYIINGYQVQVIKTVTNNPWDGGYHININATNLGSIATPDHVVVYDIVPSEFYNGATSPGNISMTPKGHQLLTSGPNDGDYAYYWDIGSLASGESNYINYDLTGSTGYDPTDLYVVGIDPAQSLNLQTTPVLSNMSTMVNANFETLAALGAAGLLVIGMIGTARRRD